MRCLFKYFILLFFIVFTNACAVKPSWESLYKNDPELVQTRVIQLPENPYEIEEYKSGHPAVVIYEFNDGRSRKMSFEANGEIIGDEWTKSSIGGSE